MQLFKLIFQTAICLKMLLNPLASIVFSCFFPSFVIVVSICLRSAVELSPPSPTIELFCCQACVSGAVTVLVCVCVCVCFFLWRRHLALHLCCNFFCAVCFPVSFAYIFKTNHKKSCRSQPEQQNHPLPGKAQNHPLCHGEHWGGGGGGGAATTQDNARTTRRRVSQSVVWRLATQAADALAQLSS